MSSDKDRSPYGVPAAAETPTVAEPQEREASEITLLLRQMAAGDEQAQGQLLPKVYDELRKLARARMARERPGQTLQPTALVHEAYLRLLGNDASFENRRHFYGAAAEAMRRIMIDRIRRYRRQRHGGDQQKVDFEDALVQVRSEDDAEEALALNDALSRLEENDRAMAEVVKLRHYGGFTIKEIADAFGTSTRTVDRQWTAAKAWLKRELKVR